MTTGLIIGKFLPPHAGHQALIDFARAHVDRLTLLLFSKSDEPIPGALRAEWLRELYPDLAIQHITEEGPVDYADPAAWDFWVRTVRAVHPEPVDFNFSSESYGEELARRLGARHLAFDPPRSRVPISATQIRADPLAHWGHLPPPVRPYYARRVAIIGAESTGKTTLAQALAAHFNTVWAPEFARDYLLAHGGVATEADMPVIAQGQAASEDQLARQANRVLICDTNVLTTRLWYEHYFGQPPADLRRLAAERRAHLYLLCAPDVPWVPDALRDSPAERAWFHERFQRELAAVGGNVVTLTGPYPARHAAAIAAVEGLLRQPIA